MPVGQVITPTGAGQNAPGFRYDRYGGLAVSQIRGKYAEDCYYARMFQGSDQGGGVAVTTSLSTTSICSLYNPVGSGVLYEICKVAIAYISGTLGAGGLFHCGAYSPTQTAPSGGTLRTVVPTLIGSTAVSTAAFRTASTVVAPVILYPFASTFAELATTANPMQVVYEDVDGIIQVTPGTTYQVQGVMGAGGTSPVISIGVLWREVPFFGFGA